LPPHLIEGFLIEVGRQVGLFRLQAVTALGIGGVGGKAHGRCKQPEKGKAKRGEALSHSVCPLIERERKEFRSTCLYRP
jgi:hypothetical protein